MINDHRTYEELLIENENLKKLLSEKIIAENTLRTSENEYRTMVQFANEPIFSFNPDETYRFVNNNYAKLVGLLPSDIIGKTLHAVFSYQEAEKRLKTIRKVFENGTTEEIEVKIISPNGKELFYTTIATPIKDENDRILWILCISTNITHQKEKAEESELKFRNFIEQSGYGFEMHNEEGRFIDVNQSTCSKLGFTRDEMLQKYIWEIDQNFTKDIFHANFLSLINKPPLTLEVNHVHKNRTVFPEEITITVLKLGNSYFSFILSRDISQRKKNEMELQRAKVKAEESENLLRVYLDHSIAWETLRDKNGKLLFATPAYEVITGYSLNDLIEGRVSIFDICHPEDKEMVISTFEDGKNGKYINNFVHRIIAKDQSVKYVNITINQVFLKNGEHYGFRTSVVDITKQKQLEEKAIILQRAVEQSSASILITDENGIIQYINKKFTELTDYSLDAAIGKNHRIIISEQTPNSIFKQMLEIILQKNEWSGEICSKKKNNETFWYYAIVSPILGSNGKITNYIAVIDDITLKKELDKTILQAIIETEEKERTRISQELHDGVNPLLSSANMFVQLLTKPNSKMDHHEIATNTQELLIEAQKIVRQLAFKLSPYILQNTGIYEAVKLFSKKIEEAGSIHIEVSTNKTVRFNSNTETILYRVLCECINNTLKHSHATHIHLVFNFAENGLLIMYSDNGSGFDYNQILKQKTGIGLYNIQKRIEIINGKLEIITNQGNGTKIVITIDQL